MKSIKLVSLVGLCIGLLNVNGMAEDAFIITQPFAVDLDNVNTNHYGGAYTILGLRIMGGTNTVATGYASSAGGEGAMATHDNVFVWSDGTLFASTLPYQFSAFASNGFRLLGGPIFGNGSGLTNLNVLGSLPANSITASKLASGAVTAMALAANSVGSTAIASSAVTSAKLAANSVGSTAIASGAVTSAKLAANSIGATAIASGAVTSAKLAANSVVASAIASNAVTSVKIQDGSIVDADIAADAGISLSKVAGLSELTNSVSEHTASVSNPHKVDAKQIGALPTQGGVIRADVEVPLYVFGNGGNGRIGLTDSETGLYGQGIGSESMMDPWQNPALGYLYRWVNTGGGPWKLYDEGNFIAGTHYLPANAIDGHNANAFSHEQLFAGKTDYSTATNIAQSVLLASGVQTNHTGDINVNGILSANGFLGDGSGLTNLNLSTAATGSITSDKLAVGAVTASKMATGSVGTSAVAAGAVTASALAANSVGSTAIASGAVTSAKLGANSVGSTAIASGAVTSAKLGANSVGSTAIASGAVTSTKLAANSVGTSAIVSNAVTSVQLANGAVTATKLATGSVETSAIATGAVTSVNLADGSIGTNKAIIAEWNALVDARSMPAVGTLDLVLGEPGRIVGGQGMSLSNISVYAYGASQLGLNGGIQTIGVWAEGASQVGENWGTQTIEESAFGALQRGYNDNVQTVGYWGIGASQVGANCGFQAIGMESFGASQNGYNVGTQTIGPNAYGAEQRGYVDYNAAATNNGIGSIQLLNLLAPQKALITGHAAIGLGACTVTNDQAIVAGDGLVSHGNGTVTARGFYGDGSGLTNLSLAATLAANSVTTEKISDSAITGAKVAIGVINSEHLAEGSVTVAKLSMNSNLNMNMNRLTNLGQPVNDGDAVTKSYLRTVLSAIPPQGDLSMGSFTNGAPASFPLSF